MRARYKLSHVKLLLCLFLILILFNGGMLMPSLSDYRKSKPAATGYIKGVWENWYHKESVDSICEKILDEKNAKPSKIKHPAGGISGPKRKAIARDFGKFIKLSEDEIKKRVQDSPMVKGAHKGAIRHPMEYAASVLASNQKKGGAKALLILYHLSKKHSTPLKKFPKLRKNTSHVAFIPIQAFRAYDLTYKNAAAWKAIQAKYPDARKSIENWLRVSLADNFRYLGKGGFGNIGVIDIPKLFQAARVLNHEIAAIAFMSNVERFTDLQYWPDGMWVEASYAYHQQTTGRSTKIRNYLSGIRYKTKEAELMRRRIVAKLNYIYSQNIYRTVVYPNGNKLNVGDTWRGDTGKINPKFVRNKAAWAYGLFPITHGSKSGVQQAWLNLDASRPRAHNHDDGFSILLWNSCRGEIFGDYGYVKDNLRYFFTSGAAHNIIRGGGGKSAPSLDAYEPGDGSKGAVQLIHGLQQDPGGKGNYRSRTLLLIPISKSRSYVVDVSAFKGGKVCSSRLNSPFETVELSNDLNFINAGKGIDRAVKKKGWPGMGHRKVKNRPVQSASGRKSGKLTWTGKNSGANVACFLNGVSGSDNFIWHLHHKKIDFQQLIRLARYEGKPVFLASTYDVWGKKGAAIIQSVKYSYPSNDSIVIEVVTKDFTDTIVVSRKPAEIKLASGETISGQYAVMRKSKARMLWAYMWGEGTLRAGKVKIDNSPSLKGKLLEYDSNKGTITVDCKLPQSAAGRWIFLRYPDGSSHGMKIVAVKPTAKGSEILFQKRLPFEQIEGDTYRLLHCGANYKFSGDIIVELPTRSFVRKGM